MKKQLLIAAVAATMTSAAIADVSITGNGKFEYFHTEQTATATNNGSSDTTNTEVNLGITGKTGDTTVVANIELNTHGNDGSGAIDVEDLYMTTSIIGDVAIKAGNYASGTTALGGEMDNGDRANNKIAISAPVGPATVSYAAATHADDKGAGATALDSDAASVAISMPIAGWTVQVKEQTDSYTMVGISGDIAGFGVRYESKDSDTADSDESFGHITKTVDNFDLGFAWYDADADGLNDEDDSAIFAVENGNAGATTGGVGDSNQQVSLKTTVDGNTISVKAGKIGYKAAGTNDRDYSQVSVTRALASGATLAVAYTDQDTANTTDKQVFEVDLSVKF